SAGLSSRGPRNPPREFTSRSISGLIHRVDDVRLDGRETGVPPAGRGPLALLDPPGRGALAPLDLAARPGAHLPLGLLLARLPDPGSPGSSRDPAGHRVPGGGPRGRRDAEGALVRADPVLDLRVRRSAPRGHLPRGRRLGGAGAQPRPA